MAYVHDVSHEDLFELCRQEDFLPELIYEEEAAVFPVVCYTILVVPLTLSTFFCLRGFWNYGYYCRRRRRLRARLSTTNPPHHQ